MAVGCDIILATTVWGMKATECDRLNAQDSAFPSSEFDNTCIRLESIIDLLELKADAQRLNWGDSFIKCMDKCIDTVAANDDVQEAIRRYYDEDYGN